MAQRYFAALPARGIVEVAGADARPFLQSLITQDLDTVTPARAGYGALLTPQGRFLHDFFILARGEGILLDCERARAPDLLARLERYRLRARVELALRSDALAVYALWGEGAAEACGLSPEPGATRALGEGAIYVDPRASALGLRALLPASDGADALAGLGFAQAGESAYERLRLALAAPDGSRDLEPERTVAAEGNLDLMGAIAWDKGCYVGQELTTRYRRRDLVKRRIVPVAVEGPLPAPGTKVMADGQEAGVIRSGLDGRALALLRVEASSGGALSCGEARLVALPLPWPI